MSGTRSSQRRVCLDLAGRGVLEVTQDPQDGDIERSL